MLDEQKYKSLLHSLIPSYTDIELEQVKAFFAFYEFYEVELNELLINKLQDHPVFGVMLKSMPKEFIAQQNERTKTLQHRAIFFNEWEPFLENMIAQGVMYAQQGIAFSTWHQLLNLVNNHLAAKLQPHFNNNLSEALPVIGGFKILIDLSLNVLAEAYMYEKSSIITAQSQHLATLIREQEEFLHAASHDLQEPLSKLLSIVSILTQQDAAELSPHLKQYLGYLEISANQMKGMVTDLLNFARIGSLSTIEKCDIRNCITAALKDLSVSTKGFDENVVHIQPLPSLLNIYPHEVQILFENLISNAYKFRNTERELNITIKAERENSSGWIFSVTDNGIGIEDNQKEKIFKLFRRIHNREDYVGSGIGLAICKKIVELHKGKLWVESKPNEGCVFKFSLADSNHN